MKGDKLKKALTRLRAAGQIRPGMLVDDDVYLGRFTPPLAKDIKTTFNVFALKEDLPRAMSYAAARECIGKMENGRPYQCDKAFYKALRQGRYKGEWIIPPTEILEIMYACKNVGAFNDTFNGFAELRTADYWSSMINPGDPTQVYLLDFASGKMSPGRKDLRLACRPIRLTPRQ